MKQRRSAMGDDHRNLGARRHGDIGRPTVESIRTRHRHDTPRAGEIDRDDPVARRKSGRAEGFVPPPSLEACDAAPRPTMRYWPTQRAHTHSGLRVLSSLDETQRECRRG
eukprot:scaffold9510_cov58-Attheya_sp.AAC.4